MRVCIRQTEREGKNQRRETKETERSKEELRDHRYKEKHTQTAKEREGTHDRER